MRRILFCISGRRVGLSSAEDMIDRSRDSSANGNGSFLLASTFCECLLVGENAVNGFLYLRNGRLAATIYERRHIKLFPRMLQQMCGDGGCALTEHITEHVIKLKVGNRKAILRSVLFAGHVGTKLYPVTAKIPKLPDISGWNEAASDKIVLEQIGDPLCIFLVRFFALDCFEEFWMADYDMTSILQHVVDWKPVLACGLHANIFAVVFGKPIPQLAKTAGVGGKPAGQVFCDSLCICGCDTGDQKIPVNVHTTTIGYTIFNFPMDTS